jgi:hypothetical protein
MFTGELGRIKGALGGVDAFFVDSQPSRCSSEFEKNGF